MKMKIELTSVFVDDQDKALKFYTKVLGFVKKLDFPAGKFKWLTVVSAEEPEGTQLLLAPNDIGGFHGPAAKTYQEALFKQSIPAANFFVEDIQKEYARLKGLGVVFTMEPTRTTGSIIAVLDDTCGNLIQLTQLTWDMNKSDRATS
jgi:catechol 2,3-dioxygenase-like lactoylglutathione lyase family enzyme